MNDPESGARTDREAHWFLPILELHPSAAVLLLFFFYVGVSSVMDDLPTWFSVGTMPRPGTYLGGLVFAAALVHFGRRWQQGKERRR